MRCSLSCWLLPVDAATLDHNPGYHAGSDVRVDDRRWHRFLEHSWGVGAGGGAVGEPISGSLASLERGPIAALVAAADARVMRWSAPLYRELAVRVNRLTASSEALDPTAGRTSARGRVNY